MGEYIFANMILCNKMKSTIYISSCIISSCDPLSPDDIWKTDPMTGKQYLVKDLAVSLAQKRYRRLLEPRDEGENNFLDSLNTDNFGPGMNGKVVDGQWVWESDGSPVTWFHWAEYGWTPNERKQGYKTIIFTNR